MSFFFSNLYGSKNSRHRFWKQPRSCCRGPKQWHGGDWQKRWPKASRQLSVSLHHAAVCVTSERRTKCLLRFKLSRMITSFLKSTLNLHAVSPHLTSVGSGLLVCRTMSPFVATLYALSQQANTCWQAPAPLKLWKTVSVIIVKRVKSFRLHHNECINE